MLEMIILVWSHFLEDGIIYCVIMAMLKIGITIFKTKMKFQLLLAILIVLSGCQQRKAMESAKNNQSSSLYSKWQLIELNGSLIQVSEGLKTPSITVAKEGRISGNASCNNFFGSFETDDAFRLKFSKMGSTMMACTDMSLERDFLQNLERVDNFTLNGDTLSLNKARMAPLLRFVRVK
jgi:heat shock protein HslJ